MVITCALGTTPEFPLFFGRGPLQSGVLQQLIQTEFTFPGEQKDWYPAEAIRQAAEDAQDLRYMIPVTQNKGYSAWYEPLQQFSFTTWLTLENCCKTSSISKAMLVIKPQTWAGRWLPALHCRRIMATLSGNFLLFNSGWNQKKHKLDSHNVQQNVFYNQNFPCFGIHCLNCYNWNAVSWKITFWCWMCLN